MDYFCSSPKGDLRRLSPPSVERREGRGRKGERGVWASAVSFPLLLFFCFQGSRLPLLPPPPPPSLPAFWRMLFPLRESKSASSPLSSSSLPILEPWLSGFPNQPINASSDRKRATFSARVPRSCPFLFSLSPCLFARGPACQRKKPARLSERGYVAIDFSPYILFSFPRNSSNARCSSSRC